MPQSYPCDVYLFDVETGERGIYRYQHHVADDHGPGVFNDYIWSEGNFSCDCNRARFFDQVTGKERDSYPCDDGINRGYLVEKIVRVSDGQTVYTEPIPADA